MDRKSQINRRIEGILQSKQQLLDQAYTKSLEELVEDLKIYQYELEFQNDELKRIQAELEETRNKYRDLFQNAPIGYVVLNENSEILYCNSPFQQMVKSDGHCEKKFDFRRLIVTEDQDKFHRYCVGLTKKKDSHELELGITTFGNYQIYVQIIGQTARTGNNIHYRFSVIDITERIITSQSLLQSEERYSGLVNKMTQGLALHELMYDPKGVAVDYRFLEVNDSFCRLTGLKRELVIGRTLRQVLPNAESLWVDLYSQVVKSGEPVHFEEYSRALDKHYDVVAYKTGDTQFAALFTDITDRRSMELDLKKRTATLNLALNATNTVIWELDFTTGKILLEGEKSVSNILGFILKELGEINIELLISKLHPDDQKVFSELYKQIADNRTQEVNYMARVKNKAGSYIWVNVQGRVTLLDINYNPVKISGILTNVDENIRKENLIRQQNSDLQRLNAEKDKFFSVLAHDLRSPLINMVSIAELLGNDYENVAKEEAHDLLKRNLSMARNTFKLLENLLDWSRFQMGMINTEKKKVGFSGFLHETVNSMADLANAKEIKIELNSVVDVELIIDEKMIASVVRNLLTNAIKFSKRNSRVFINSHMVASKFVIISVRDQGIGMNAETLKEVFNITHKKGQPGTEGELSNGLGLILCREFVEYHGGKIVAQSEPGAGSTFSFSLPLK